MRKTAVISFGCPRSGTTFLARCLSPLVGILPFHLPDGSKLHPSKSPDGLFNVNSLFWEYRVVYVRIVRHPLDIAESFLALRKISPGAARALDSDERIVRWIVNEHKHTEGQRDHIVLQQPKWGSRDFIEVRYEALAEPEGRDAFARCLTKLLPNRRENRGILCKELRNYGRRPSGPGKLRSRLAGEVMTPEQRVYFEEELATVISEGGYEMSKLLGEATLR